MGPLIPLFWTSGDVSKPEWAALFALGRDIHYIHSLRFASGVTIAKLLAASMAPHACFSRGRMPDSIGRPPAYRSHVITTRPLHLLLFYKIFSMNLLLVCSVLKLKI